MTKGDDGKIAIFWDKIGLGHNGQRLARGGHSVYFLNGQHDVVTEEEWPQFLEEQAKLIASRDELRISPLPQALDRLGRFVFMRVRHRGGLRTQGPQEKKKPRLGLGTAPNERDLQHVAVPLFFSLALLYAMRSRWFKINVSEERAEWGDGPTEPRG
jgi:hypothetical protein